MPKGFFTQTACVLLKRRVSLQHLKQTLASFQVQGSHKAADSWAFGGPSLTLAFRPEVNGYVVVDIVNQLWPDHMGDSAKDPKIFGAWLMGHFGPFTYPGGLQRAAVHCWNWEPGRTIANNHRAFIRIRSSYVFGAKKDAPTRPKDYDPIPELKFVTDIALATLELPEALCYFNPNGEVLRDRVSVRESLGQAKAAKVLPLDIWCNIRLFNIDAGWCLMDTVGNGQLDLPDIEACFSGNYDCAEVDRFLRNVSLHLLQKGKPVKDGDTMNGPGNVRWRVASHENGLTTDPPRAVLGWLPLDNVKVPEEILSR